MESKLFDENTERLNEYSDIAFLFSSLDLLALIGSVSLCFWLVLLLYYLL